MSMNWFEKERERLENTAPGQEILKKHADLIAKIDKILEDTDTENLKFHQKDELVDRLLDIMKEVQAVKSETIELDEKNVVDMKNVFERIIKTLNTRVNKKWEEEVLNYLQVTMEKLGMSQAELANRSGYSHSYINRIASLKRTNISLDVFKSICEALGLDMATVLKEVGDNSFGERNEVMNFEDVLLKSSFEINGSLVSSKQKMAIAKLVTELINLDWEENMTNINQVVRIVNEFKK